MTNLFCLWVNTELCSSKACDYKHGSKDAAMKNDNHQCPSSTFISSHRLPTEHAHHSHIQKLYRNFQTVPVTDGYIRKIPLLWGDAAQCQSERLSTTSTGWIIVLTALWIVIYYSGYNLGSDLCIYLFPKHSYSIVSQAL